MAKVSNKVSHRVGVIPFDEKDGAIALLFVTSQTRGRWILPKGVVKQNESHVEACRREALEEAGVVGQVLEDYPITMAITKQTDSGKELVPVTYYPLFVTDQQDDWLEKERRQRHWALVKDASRVAHREDYLRLINQFSELLPFVMQELPSIREVSKAA